MDDVNAGQLTPGRPWPLGAQAQAEGVNFAVFSAHATAIELCTFDSEGHIEVARLHLPCHTGEVWHGFLPNAGSGLVYGLRAHGPWRPDQGHHFNVHKLLLDPWAREIVGQFDWDDAHFGADRQYPQHMDARDNSRWALKARVVVDTFDWQSDIAPQTPLTDTVLYEVHVRNFTRLMPRVPAPCQGTYLGLASAPALDHLKRLGVTAVSLLPVHQHLSEERLMRHGLVNHWGYNSLGFFCPDPRYATSPNGQVARDEFRQMVRTLHAEGIEVILDVVYNHTPEGDEHGPTISWRGLDSRSWYRHAPDAPQHCENLTGCGNTLNVSHPRVMQFVLDSLRYWVQDMHVDGFRFDLAPVLGRTQAGFDRHSAFFQALAQDPVLARVKLIAEPWDIGEGGYQLGQFPNGWLEWNDRFRDTTRAFWLGGEVTRGQFALRLAASADVFQARRRSPVESVNYVVSHDGFTLRDLVSFNHRRNHANLENNRDGTDNNLSWNCGVEGESHDPAVQQLRQRLQRALLASLLLAQGTPMLAAGDELGHSQHGNNNPYNQDNTITWIDWSQADEALIAFTARVIALRQRLLPLANRWYTGLADVAGLPDLSWLRRTGDGLGTEHWGSGMSRILGAWIGAPGRATRPLLLLINGRDFDVEFTLPRGHWRGELDTAEADGEFRAVIPDHGALLLRSRSLLLLQDGGQAQPSSNKAAPA